MSAPRSAATKTAQKAAKASSVSDFKKARKAVPLLLPSGLVILARRVALRTFIKQGDVPNPLLPIVEEALNKGREMDVNDIVGKDGVNLDMVDDMYEMVNAVVMQVCVEPQVHPEPEGDEERDEELLYIDEFDDEDKMFIFQWSSGGTSDVATFRREAESGLVSLVEGQGGEQSSK